MKQAILIIFLTPLYLLFELIAKLVILILQLPMAIGWIAMFWKHRNDINNNRR